jgi:major membrane immunogen (membrane-anchored lipoprotein)
MKGFIVVSALLLAGCANSGKINAVQTGMTREQVEAVMGKPVSTSSQGNLTYLNYKLAETSKDAQWGRETPYYVRLQGGKVESFGRTGDFNSTQVPTVRQQVEQVGAGASDTYAELLKLKDLHDKGLLTDQEFETRRNKLVNGK